MAPTSPEQPEQLGRIVNLVKGWVERCGRVWVEAQVIELNRRAGGTQYLVLRDRFAEISARVSCSTAVLDAAGPITDGMTVVAQIQPRVWPKNSSLIFECHELRVAGEGRLLAQLEQLKRKLQAEGLFDPVRKKRLPFLPRAIGLITGANSAAERDVLATIANRWPAAGVRVRHTLVQGPEAAAQVMTALADLDRDPDVQVIIIARGGGSLEDLLAFSDEGLVRAVAACRTPVVTGVGHESDTPIVDLAADVRASTPTDAAKRVVPDAAQESARVQDARVRIRQAIVSRVLLEQRNLDQLRSRPVLADPAGSFGVHLERLAHLRSRLDAAIDRRLETEQTRLTHDLVRARSMSPMATLERGYSILVTGEGRTVVSVHDVDEDDDLLAHVADGQLVLGVRSVEPHTPAPRRKP